jgi:hypothetical protein
MYSHVSTAAHVSSIPAPPSRKGALPAAPQFAARQQQALLHFRPLVPSSPRPPFCATLGQPSRSDSATLNLDLLLVRLLAHRWNGDGGPADLDNLSPCRSTLLMYLTPPSYVMMEIRPERAQPESIRPSSMQPTAQLHCTVLPAVRTRAGTGAAILCLTHALCESDTRAATKLGRLPMGIISIKPTSRRTRPSARRNLS